MEIERQVRNGVTLLAPAGRIDTTTSPALDDELTRLVDAGTRDVLVDLGRVDYISSAGLRVLLVLAKRLGTERGRLVLCCLDGPVRQVFDLAGFLPLFTVEDSREAGFARFGSAR
jgi:stage II sporulation protein AA (anti-sigma F factor antagonist)